MVRTATSTDYFVGTPVNSITARSKLRIDNLAMNLSAECTVDVRINQENYTRALAIHIPSTSAPFVAGGAVSLIPQLRRFADLLVGERNLILARSPDVRIGSEVQVQNGEQVLISFRAPWRLDPVNTLDCALSRFVHVYCDADDQDVVFAEPKRLAAEAGFELIFLGTSYINSMVRGERPPFFISYDSRTEDGVARPIAARLWSKGERVWFDKFSMRPGDNIREAIENGLRQCDQCVLLVTREFVGNEGWARVEYDAIFGREIAERRKLIIPVWVDVTRDEVSRFSLALAGKLAIVCTSDELATEAGLERVAHAITTGRNPD